MQNILEFMETFHYSVLCEYFYFLPHVQEVKVLQVGECVKYKEPPCFVYRKTYLLIYLIEYLKNIFMLCINLEPEPPPQVSVVEVVPDAEPEGEKTLTPRYSTYSIIFLNILKLYLFLKLCLSSLFALSG